MEQTMYYYFNRRFAKPVSFAFSLDGNYDQGATWEDFITGRWVPLTEAQQAYVLEHPAAGNEEVWYCGAKPRDLAEEKDRKLADLMTYDASLAVNSFKSGNAVMWLSREDRAALRMRFEAEEAAGVEVTTMWFEGNAFTLPLAQARVMLMALERYAAQCYDNTQRHYASIMGIDTLEALDAYDFTTGYPEQLSF